MIYGLKEQVIDQIIAVLAGFPQVEEAILYGSRAMGNFKPGSDIDLALKGNLLNLHVLNSISRLLNNLSIPYTVDLSIYHRIDNTDLLDHINRVGVVLYQKSKTQTRIADSTKVVVQ